MSKVTNRTGHYNHNKEYESTLSEFRVNAGFKIKELCKALNITQNEYSSLNSGTMSPITKYGNVRESAGKIAEFFGADLYDLWPLYFCPMNQTKASDEELICTFHQGLFDEEFDDPAVRYEKREDSRSFYNLIKAKLSKRELEVMKLRMNDETLEDIGDLFKVSRERVRQVEKKAINMIRGALAADRNK